MTLASAPLVAGATVNVLLVSSVNGAASAAPLTRKLNVRLGLAGAAAAVLVPPLLTVTWRRRASQPWLGCFVAYSIW